MLLTFPLLKKRGGEYSTFTTIAFVVGILNYNIVEIVNNS